jgi:hypothetical protein
VSHDPDGADEHAEDPGTECEEEDLEINHGAAG